MIFDRSLLGRVQHFDIIRVADGINNIWEFFLSNNAAHYSDLQINYLYNIITVASLRNFAWGTRKIF